MVSDDKPPGVTLDIAPGEYAPHKVLVDPTISLDTLRQLSFRYMQDGFSIVDAQGLHVDVNPAFCAMTGYSAEELVGSGPEHRYWPPEEREHIQEAFSKTLGGEFADVELVFMRKNGERFPVIVNPFAIRDGSGEIVYFAATVKDITRRTQMQLSLQQSERRFRSLFESAADAIIILEGSQIVDCNEQALNLFGVASFAQLRSRVAFDFFPPTQPNGQDSRAYSIEKLKEAQAGKPQFFSWSHVKFDGTPFTAEVSLSTFQLDNQTIIQAIVRDVTQPKKMEEALRHSEQQYRSLFEHAGDGILIMQDEYVIDCNDRVLEIYGITREQLLNLHDYSLSPPIQPNGQTSSDFYRQRMQALQSGHSQSFEWLGSKLDGSPIETEVTLTTFVLDGKPCTQSLIRDITQRKQLQAAIMDSEMRFRTLFDTAGDAISILKEGRTVDCNKRLCEIYDLTRDEILSVPVIGFFPPTQPNGQASSEFFAEKLRAARAGQPQVYEWYGHRKDGTDVITEVNLSTLVIGGEVYDQAIARDITQRKALEAELVDLNKNLEDRVAQRTEELERAYAEILQRNSQYRALAKKLTQAEDAERKRIARLLHDNHQQLLAAAKFKAQMLQSSVYGTDINSVGGQILEILDQALELTRSLTMELAPPIIYGAGLVAAMQWLSGWMQENHQLQVLVVGSLPVIPVPPDVSNLLFRSVRELLFNVVKHSGVRLARVDIVVFDKGLRISVSDDGSGFDVADVLQAPRSYGLFSIQEQLSALGGRMDIHSTAQGGTLCTLSVPVDSVEAALSNSSPAQDLLPAESITPHPLAAGPIRILVADDHSMARGALVQILGLLEDFCVVGEAVDGLDAVEQARLLKPDVVLMDATMPRLSGLEATRCITAELPQVKVIALSMQAKEDMQAQMSAAGAVGYLQKLTPVDELFATIRRVMHREEAGERQ